MTEAAFAEWADESRVLAEEAAPAVAEVVLEDADVRAYVSRLWAEDWDCPEDAVYDR